MGFNLILCYHPNLVLAVLLLFSCSFGLFSANDEVGTGQGETFTVSSFSYPETRLRPFDLRYIRVDLPPWFSALSIALKSDVDIDISRIERVPTRTLPIICFRDGSPPLPDALNTSLKDSATSGINGLDVEQCFPMQKNITMKLTNNQISPGVWYIGLFNGIGPTRTQSKMTFVRRGSTPFESYYLPVGGASYDSANFPLEPLLKNSSYIGESDSIWTYFLLDIPRGAAGGNIHIQLSSDTKIGYEVYARFGGLPSLDIWDYYYANKTRRSDPSMFFTLYDSSDTKVNFYIMYAREGTWGFGLRHLNSNSDYMKGLNIMSISLERCPKRCSSHGDCKFSFDASGLTSYSFCSCDRNHGGFDCSIEIVTHQGHVRQSVFLIVSNAAAILPAYWALRKKALAEWVLYTSSGISSGLYHACDVGTWCALSYNVLQFMDFWLSFMAVISTFLYLTTIDEVFKRAIHTAVAILTALMAATKATRSSNVILVIVIGALGLFVGWLIEISTKYRSLSFPIGISFNFSHCLQTIKRWLYNLVKTLLRRYHLAFALAGFTALAMAAISWTLETSESYWFWHSIWHITIYTSSFFFLCSKANIEDSETTHPTDGNYELTHQDSLPRSG
ncbi:uncharacterized protein LOC108328932 isoform X3 [Vigna angularis]|uniref:uncharacterized protein LOC108328932 isoform X3 n=1 Tax=Phaseolus angularis TaxID=3914 RepID=UPI0022B565AB|nr:uncharacterized protein LOC108328932 isoform X3 [Vigna angularis]